MAEWTQADLTAINRAIASGSREVEYGGPTGTRKVRYGSLEELLQIRALIRADLGITTDQTYLRRAQTRKDLD